MMEEQLLLPFEPSPECEGVWPDQIISAMKCPECTLKIQVIWNQVQDGIYQTAHDVMCPKCGCTLLMLSEQGSDEVNAAD